MTQRNMTSKRDGAHVQGTRVIDDRFESVECALEREQAAADALTPDWDMASRVTTARGALVIRGALRSRGPRQEGGALRPREDPAILI